MHVFNDFFYKNKKVHVFMFFYLQSMTEYDIRRSFKVMHFRAQCY